MSMTEAPKYMNEEYLQLNFFPYTKSERISVFEASLYRSNTVVKMSQKLPHLKLQILKGPKPSYMSGLADAGSGLNLGNLEYHQSVAERHPNLVLKILYLKDMENVDPFNISGVDGGKESEQEREGQMLLQ